MHSSGTIAEWLEIIIGHEGGYTDNPKDPGNWTGPGVGQGECRGTKWGISANAYPHLNILDLDVEDAIDIYITDYLLPLHAHQYGPKLAFQMLDYAINSGVSAAIRALQRVVRVKADGNIGPVTVAALKAIEDDRAAAIRLLSDRMDWMTQLGTWDTFGRGWARRIARNMREAVK